MIRPASAHFCPLRALVATSPLVAASLAGCGPHGGIERTARASEALSNTWVATGAMAESRYDHAAARLADGRVLVTGGFGDTGAETASAEIYDPATNTWSPAAPMPVARQTHGAALLGNGKILVGGGSDPSFVTYDPASDAWTPAASPPSLPSPLQLTSLPDGRVMASCQYLYDPTTDSWSSPAPFPGASGGDLMPDGTVFCRKGIYDPASDTWTAVQGAWAEPDASATCASQGGTTAGSPSATRVTSAALADGRALVVTARWIPCKNPVQFFAIPVIPSVYDPATQTWTAGQPFDSTGSYDITRIGVAALADGDAIIFANEPGKSSGGLYRYIPSSDAWLRMNTAFGYMELPYVPPSPPSIDAPLPATTTSLADGTVLYVYTKYDLSSEPLASSYRYGYEPSTLGAPCVADAQCASGHCADGVCCDTACNGGPCDACSAAAGATADGTCALFSGLPCDDGNACTQADACDNGVCVGGNPVDCTAPDACHVGACDPATGTCDNPTAPDGTTCPEGTCQAGACVSAPDGGGMGGSGGDASSSSSSGSGGSGGGASSSSSSGSGSAASTSSTSSSSSSSSSGGTPAPGGGCALAVEGGPEPPRAWAALALLAVARRILARRRARWQSSQP